MTLQGQIRRLVFSVLVLLFFVVVLYSTSLFRLRVAGYFPGFAALMGLSAVAILVVVEARKILAARRLALEPAVAGPDVVTESGEIIVDDDAGEGADIDPGRFRRALLWVVAAVALVALLGLLAGAGVFLVLFLRYEGRESWTYTVLATGVAIGLLMWTADLFRLQWPESLFEILFG